MREKIDYTALDAAIVAGIKAGRTTAGLLLDDHHKAIARMNLRDQFGKPMDEFRVLDKRLQALRKAGKIKFSHGARKWSAL